MLYIINNYRYTLKSFLFQILTELKKLRYLNVKQHSMIEQKVTKQHLEIVNHREHFDVLHVHPSV